MINSDPYQKRRAAEAAAVRRPENSGAARIAISEEKLMKFQNRKIRTFALIAALLALTALLLVGCTGQEDPPKDTPSDESYRVMVSCTTGVSVVGENPIEVKSGDDAVFTVRFEDGYVLDSLSAGSLDGDRLTIPNVTKNTAVTLKAARAYRVEVVCSEGVSVTGENPVSVKAGSDATFAVSFAEGYTLQSLSAGSLSSGVLTVPAIAADTTVEIVAAEFAYLYDPNGGTVDPTSRNMTAATYYTAALTEDGRVRIRFSEDYAAKFGVLSTFWDDGTFHRQGYLLKEYNTKPDGSGEGYSLGSKFWSAPVDGRDAVLYCIWERVYESDFLYEDHTFARPAGVSAQNAPDWQESGVIVTGYRGAAKTLAVPETLGGKPVIAIKSGAFRDLTATELILPKTLLVVEDGAFTGCSALKTIYYSDSVWQMNNEALDSASYQNFTRLIVNATKAPRYSNTGEGAFAYKLAKLLRTVGQQRVIMIAGSSSYQGLGTDYLEALLEDYTVVNFGTTRTTHGTIYLEAMGHFTTARDLVLYAPENSIYMLGEPELYWKTLRDLEGVNNFFRYIDISGYTNVFGAFTDFNQNYAYKRPPLVYEQVIGVGNITEDGDYFHPNRAALGSVNDQTGRYIDSYFITLNERVKSKDEGNWADVRNQTAHKDYTDLSDPTWATFTDETYTRLVDRAFAGAKSSGAKAYFTFCPVDASKLVEGVDGAWLQRYDDMIKAAYSSADGVLGQSKNYVFHHQYFYDCAFHPNDYGRTWRTYRVYRDLCALLGRTALDPDAKGVTFAGCLFEDKCFLGPTYPVDLDD